MATTEITQEDLLKFKSELLDEIQKMFYQNPELIYEGKWLKSHQVRHILGISNGTLQNLRINGTIPYSKIGGVIFYSQADIENIIKNNKRNAQNNGKLR